MDWVMTNCAPAIEANLLRVYDTMGKMPYWFAAVGKNTSHRLATQDIVVNVDANNLIGCNFPLSVVTEFDSGCRVLQYEQDNGSAGRIACLREDFLYIRGYDESAYPVGALEKDLVLRLMMLYDSNHNSGYKMVRNAQHSQTIPKEDVATLNCCSPVYEGVSSDRMETVNEALFQVRREAGNVRRNMYQEEIGKPAKRVRLHYKRHPKRVVT